MKTLLRKFNWRLFVIHFLAMWLFMDAFISFAALYDYHFERFAGKAFSHNNFDKGIKIILNAYPKSNLGSRIMNNALRMNLLKGIGLLGAFLISLGITIRLHWFWPNSLIAFLGIFIICRYYNAIPAQFSPIFYISYIEYIFPHKIDSIWGFATTAIVTQIIGLLLFFSNRVPNFIDKGGHKPTATNETKSGQTLVVNSME